MDAETKAQVKQGPILLEHWGLVPGSGNSPFTPPEAWTRRLTGKVYGDSRFPDGSEITTSNIRRVEFMDCIHVFTKSGTEYVLGAPSQEYLHSGFNVYPNTLAWFHRTNKAFLAEQRDPQTKGR